MTFKQIKKLLKDALHELEIEVISDTPDITDEELKIILDIAKEKILTEMSVDLDEFYNYEQSLKEIGKAKSEKKRQELKQTLQEQEERITGKIPTLPETLNPEAIRALIKDSTDQIKPTNTVINKIVKETTVKQPIITREKTVIKEINESILDEVKKDIFHLQETVSEIKIPEPVDLEAFKIRIDKDSANALNKLWGDIPNFRALGMGLRGDLDKLRIDFDTFAINENLWDDSGTYLTQHTANYPVNLGTGNLTTTGTLGAGATTIAPNLTVTGVTVTDGIISTGKVTVNGIAGVADAGTVGSSISFTSGVGSSLAAGLAKAGGPISFTTASGGAGNQGGAAGNITFTGGNGGVGTALGNTGGSVVFATGAGSAGAAGVGGAAGTVTMTTGIGGSGVGANGGIGGHFNIILGAGGSSDGTGGIGGNFAVTLGAAGAGGSTSTGSAAGVFAVNPRNGGDGNTGGNAGTYSFGGTSGSRGGNGISNGTNDATGGTGGSFSMTGATSGFGGGANTTTSGRNTGGKGMSINFALSAGGTASLGGINVGGSSGDMVFAAANGGAATSAVGKTATGGKTGDMFFGITSTGQTRKGGAATGGGTNTGGRGGDLIFGGQDGGDASGGTSNTGGAGTTVTFLAGLGGTGATANGANGHFLFKIGSTEIARFDNTAGLLGRFGIGIAPTAMLTLKAGTATAGTAPLKFTLTAAVLTTAAVAGQVEPDATTSLYYTDITPTRKKFLFSIGQITNATDTYQILTSDETIVCNKTTAFTVTLPTGVVGQQFSIKNIGAGLVTVSLAGDTIDGETSQTVDQWSCMKVQCYASNKWGII